MLITSLNGGGAEKVASELSLHFNRSIKRDIIRLNKSVAYPTNDPIYTMDIGYDQYNIFSIVRALIVSIIKYRKFLNNSKPDVSMSFLVLDNLINVLSNMVNTTKVILSVHIALSMKFGNHVLGMLAKKVVRFLYNRARARPRFYTTF